MAEIGKGYVQIIPTAEGISGKISEIFEPETKRAGDEGGKNIVSGIKSALVKLGVGAAVGKVIKDSLDAGGALQQSFGGLETLYGDAADAAKKFAMQAASAGIDANTYAEQAVSFGAALKQAFKGAENAEELAANAANTAIMDMADNAAKMGTDIGAIQTAYQGFAKQNYTMLDNLKLGYGGTKQEMERLLADATKLSGVKYDLDNLGDVYEAIHVIQTDLGLTGVAAEEAAQTFSGSLGAVKAAWQNILAGLTTGEDISLAMKQLGESVKNFLTLNLFPMIGKLFSQLPNLLGDAMAFLFEEINVSSLNADGLVAAVTGVVEDLAYNLIGLAPYLVKTVFTLLSSLGNALITFDWKSFASETADGLLDTLHTTLGETGVDVTASSAVELVNGLITGMLNKVPDFLTSVQTLLKTFGTAITDYLPTVLSSGIEICTNLISGVLEGIPGFIAVAGETALWFVTSILDSVPTVLAAGAELLLNLINGIISNIPALVSSAITAVMDFAAGIAQKLPEILQKGIELLGQLASGIIKAIPDLVAKLPEVFTGIKDAFDKYDWKKIGIDILTGIGEGIKNAVSNLVESAKGAASQLIEGVKNRFGTHSPSKVMADEVGRWIPAGIAKGIMDNIDVVTSAMNDVEDSIRTNSTATVMIGNKFTPGDAYSVTDNLIRIMDSRNQNVAVNVTLQGDAANLFKVVKQEDKKFKTRTGSSRFAY